MQREPDLVLVQAAINGDADSFTELCRRYYPAMVAIAHSVLGDRHRAEMRLSRRLQMPFVNCRS